MAVVTSWDDEVGWSRVDGFVRILPEMFLIIRLTESQSFFLVTVG